MKILVAIISYNEEKNIKKTIIDLQQHNTDYDIVLIDNGSSDNTVKIAKDMGIPVVAHCTNTGASSGVLMSYMLYAYRNNYDVLCQFDGDGQHLASELPKIIKPVENSEADYVIGSRFIEKKGFQSYAFRRMGIKLFSVIDSIIIDQKITDMTSGARAYSRKVMKFFAMSYRHEVYDTSQLLILSHFAGAKIKEVPILMRAREHGKSEFHFFGALSFPIKGMISIIGTMLQKKQIRKINYGN
jgi:glycosyltransferase involved in cell wall biosynthesis